MMIDVRTNAAATIRAPTLVVHLDRDHMGHGREEWPRPCASGSLDRTIHRTVGLRDTFPATWADGGYDHAAADPRFPRRGLGRTRLGGLSSQEICVLGTGALYRLRGVDGERPLELGDRGWRELLLTASFADPPGVRAVPGRHRARHGRGRVLRALRRSGTRDPLRDGDPRVGRRELGLDVRAGLHTGECELLDNKVAGIAVSIGAALQPRRRRARCSSRRLSRTLSPAPGSDSKIAAPPS